VTYVSRLSSITNMSTTRMCNISGFHHGTDLSCGFLKYITVQDGSRITVSAPRYPWKNCVNLQYQIQAVGLFLLFSPILLYGQPFRDLSVFYVKEAGTMSLRNTGDLRRTTQPVYTAESTSKSSVVPSCGP
jgi:hypothetical protein